MPEARPFDDVFDAARKRERDYAEMEGLGMALLRNCRLRYQLGPAQLALPGATTVIQNTLWLPWLSGSGTWMLYGLFEEGPDGAIEGNITHRDPSGGG